jgi:PhzF family phenazine biosynthesis protein
MALRDQVLEASAFVGEGMRGNPAGVCVLEEPADPREMQAVAAEVGHAETAFLWPEGGAWRIRWFTPAVEVDLCGHATLASAFILSSLGRLAPGGSAEFDSRSGRLSVRCRTPEEFILDFPALEPVEAEPALPKLKAVWTGRSRDDWFAALGSAAEVEAYRPDFEAIASAGMRGLIITARDESGRHDAVSRFFAPQSGVPEDPVTGSAHCAIGPFWAGRLGRSEARCRQASERGGELTVRIRGGRVDLIGRARMGA